MKAGGGRTEKQGGVSGIGKRKHGRTGKEGSGRE